MSRLSWNEIRVRAAAFARDWADAHYERGQTQSFYNEFFQVFGLDRKRVATFEHAVKLLSGAQGFVDLFWPGKLLVEQKSRGRDMEKARDQAFGYCRALEAAQVPEYLLLCDFATFRLEHLETREVYEFALADLPRHVERFGFMLGVRRREFRDQDPVNIAAAEKLGALHDAMLATGYTGHALERFLVRIVFCLFADDTSIFESNALEFYLQERTREDGSDLGMQLTQLFQVLNTPEAARLRNLDADLAAFPYVNGALFAEMLPIPSFDSAMRRTLLEACQFDWSRVSPAVFGSLFQSVMDARERREKGAHYTTEANILKVIEPLFLDELRAELDRARRLRRGADRDRALVALHDRIAAMNLFDPACGCGNFLVIAYRELRELEIELLAERHHNSVQVEFAGDLLLSRINVDQFHGIEIGEFAAEIARTAMWMMDHIMNMRLGERFGQVHVRIPLKAAANICHADALEVDWATVVPPSRCTHILGNPPFVGAKYQSELQRAQVRRIAGLPGSGGTLDFVCAWFLLAAEYARAPQSAVRGIGFVSTNSITQGEQVAQLWPLLFARGLELAFAHRTFAWGSDARGKAHVHVVALGLVPAAHEPRQKRLFSYPDVNGTAEETTHDALSPYLIDASRLRDRHIVVADSSVAPGGWPSLCIGSKPIDGGHYIFTHEQWAEFVQQTPEAAVYGRPYIGAEEFLNGGGRVILALHTISPSSLRSIPRVVERVQRVAAFRRASSSKPTQKLAETPLLYHVNVLPHGDFLVIPKVSSERRQYVPMGWLSAPTIPSDLLFVLDGVTKWQFAILTSAAHMAWMRLVSGRLKSDYRYSASLSYNTFPVPEVSEAAQCELAKLAEAVLAARAEHPDATLADLYDPDAMPTTLRKAHQALDRYVDRLYEPRGFANERERVEHLLGCYEQQVAPMLAATGTGAKGKRGGKKAAVG